MCCCCGREKRIVNDYLKAINEVKSNSSFLKETSQNEKILPQKGDADENRPALTDAVIVDKKVYEDRLNHYEKLYRCYIDSRRVRLSRWLIVAVSVVLAVTIFCCAFGPNFKSQESMNTSSATSTNSVVIGGYADRGSYGYTYFQESENGKR